MTNLELIVEVLNINPGNNEALLSKCKKLQEYVLYIKKVRDYVLEMPIEQAVERAVNECIQEGILVEFLLQNKAEAIAMSIFEYNEEEHMKSVRQEGYSEGKAEDIIVLLEGFGEVPMWLRERIFHENNFIKLKEWLKLAARAEDIDDFVKDM